MQFKIYSLIFNFSSQVNHAVISTPLPEQRGPAVRQKKSFFEPEMSDSQNAQENGEESMSDHQKASKSWTMFDILIRDWTWLDSPANPNLTGYYDWTDYGMTEMESCFDISDDIFVAYEKHQAGTKEDIFKLFIQEANKNYPDIRGIYRYERTDEQPDSYVVILFFDPRIVAFMAQ